MDQDSEPIVERVLLNVMQIVRTMPTPRRAGRYGLWLAVGFLGLAEIAMIVWSHQVMMLWSKILGLWISWIIGALVHHGGAATLKVLAVVGALWIWNTMTIKRGKRYENHA
ncbi:MAG: hypothetical protein C7B46_08835 [Sulfobacillus benefaciens]|uniref:Uncharacterized protein n=1 Tax=Sulfobacillus benefaciens TaxID=453960 RepID=A0A2T2XGS1_9FIRM|nr:MAG: hypothetical protein C7B46_08835 [Sulfobacillus benefaciens]